MRIASSRFKYRSIQQVVNLYRPGLLTTTKWHQHNIMDHHKLYSTAACELRWGWMDDDKAPELHIILIINIYIYLLYFKTLFFYHKQNNFLILCIILLLWL